MALAGKDIPKSNVFADIALATLAILVVVILIIPLPTALIDFFLVVNLSVSILILLVALNIVDPLELTVFPQLLLVTTLFRLAMTVEIGRAHV